MWNKGKVLIGGFWVSQKPHKWQTMDFKNRNQLMRTLKAGRK